MTATRIVVRGATTALTRRTTLRKAFLAPWHPLVEACWLYSLAHAQLETSVAVHHSVLDEVREALREEAADIVEHADLELCTITRSAIAGNASMSSDDASSRPEREPTHVRRRFDGKPERRPDARRIVVLRDRRRGRPPNGGRRHGSDPPARAMTAPRGAIVGSAALGRCAAHSCARGLVAGEADLRDGEDRWSPRGRRVVRSNGIEAPIEH